MRQKKSAKELLIALGETAEEVAKSLRRRRIKSKIGDGGNYVPSMCCPLAVYLQKNGYPKARVFTTYFTLEYDDEINVALTGAAQHFVLKFDEAMDPLFLKLRG
jgi:hypothetical protein